VIAGERRGRLSASIRAGSNIIITIKVLPSSRLRLLWGSTVSPATHGPRIPRPNGSSVTDPVPPAYIGPSPTYVRLHGGHDESYAVTRDLELVGLVPGQDGQDAAARLERVHVGDVVLRAWRGGQRLHRWQCFVDAGRFTRWLMGSQQSLVMRGIIDLPVVLYSARSSLMPTTLLTCILCRTSLTLLMEAGWH
jgi:hypothetical protein